MCDLYGLRSAPDEVGKPFGATSVHAGNAAGEVYPGYPGLVFARGELRSMVWGFPLATRGKTGQPLKPRPVNNTRADKLGSFIWRYSFAERRCLIPITEFVNCVDVNGSRPSLVLGRRRFRLGAARGTCAATLNGAL